MEQNIANKLLQIKAIRLSPSNPFTWASGWKSPIYCDNRMTLSFPEIRKTITNAFVKKIEDLNLKPDVIAGVATGAIAQGVLVADKMNLPFVYVRSSAKGHGMKNLVEGKIEKGQKVVVIEDLISTGGSSLKAVEALREVGADVLHLLAIFTYGFDVAIQNFKKANCNVSTLSNYNSMIETAITEDYVGESDLETLKSWRINPAEWGK